ncbi:conserved protein, unknown function [Hepatocystis sp. ex Piliocolobus tephrosceles]|nr:conserved protein, unknown function [Hepatocystis sp. ex Piliocolobus tephrosceles]
MKKHIIILFYFIIIFNLFLIVNAVVKKDLHGSFKKGRRNDPAKKKEKVEIMKDTGKLSNIELKSNFLKVLGTSSLMQHNLGMMERPPIYRHVYNIHDYNENNGAVVPFVLFSIVILFVLFFIFYFIVKSQVKHIKYMQDSD